MNFCVIAPTIGLQRYSTLSKWHLVLAHECERDKMYLRFYCRRKEEGDFIILDNGSYENGKPYYNWDIIRALEPDVIVLPDFPLQPWKKTWHAAITWLDQNTDDIDDIEVLYVPQAEPGDYHGFIESYQAAMEDPRINWLGIPRCLATNIARDPLARVLLARLVRQSHPHIKLHAFGMVAGDIHELPYLKAAGVTSIDSSAPVWRGWNGYSVERWKEWKDIPVNFSADANGESVYRHTILCNLEACGVDTNKLG